VDDENGGLSSGEVTRIRVSLRDRCYSSLPASTHTPTRLVKAGSLIRPHNTPSTYLTHFLSS